MEMKESGVINEKHLEESKLLRKVIQYIIDQSYEFSFVMSFTPFLQI
jgi:hypothetical protein